MAVPGLRGIEHVGLTVPDLEAAQRFFVDVLGCAFVFADGPYANAPDFMTGSLGVDPKASFRYAFLRCGHGANLEVFEYQAPDQAEALPKNSDVGGHHFCFYVDDIEAAVAYLRAHGIRVLDLNEVASGPAAGSRWVYFLAPWGLQLELVSYPGGKGPPGGPARRLWSPARPEL